MNPDGKSPEKDDNTQSDESPRQDIPLADITRKVSTGIKEKCGNAVLDSESVEEKISVENLALIENPIRKAEYTRCAETIIRLGYESDIPSFDKVMELLMKIGNKKLDALRMRGQHPTLIVAPKMTGSQLSGLEYQGKIGLSRNGNKCIFDNGYGYRVGLIEGEKEPYIIDHGNNHDYLMGIYYDDIYAELAALGLRSPRISEYIALFEMKKSDRIHIDKTGATIIDNGQKNYSKREKTINKQKEEDIPVGTGEIVTRTGGPVISVFSPSCINKNVHVRASAWVDCFEQEKKTSYWI